MIFITVVNLSDLSTAFASPFFSLRFFYPKRFVSWPKTHVYVFSFFGKADTLLPWTGSAFAGKNQNQMTHSFGVGVDGEAKE